MQTTKAQISLRIHTVWSASLLFTAWIEYISTCYIQNFKPLPSFCGCAGQFESYLVANPKDRFSCDVVHILNFLYKISVQVVNIGNWATSSKFGTYCLCEQQRFRWACVSTQSRQNRCSLIQAASQEEPSDRKPDPWPLWMPGYAQLKFVMTECSKTQIRLTCLN